MHSIGWGLPQATAVEEAKVVSAFRLAPRGSCLSQQWASGRGRRNEDGGGKGPSALCEQSLSTFGGFCEPFGD